MNWEILGTGLSVVLLVEAVIPGFLGVTYFWREKKVGVQNGVLRCAILGMGLSATVWSFGYGVIGIADNYGVAILFRTIGLVGVPGFMFSEAFLYIMQAEKRKLPRNAYIILFAILSFLDWYFFSNPEVDEFISIGSWTTFHGLPSPYRIYHNFYVVFTFLLLLYFGTKWLRQPHYKRDREFIRNIYFANFFMIFSCIPDTFLSVIGKPALPTSSIGATLTVISVWLTATNTNAFALNLPNLTRYLMNSLDIGILVFDHSGKIVIANAYSESQAGREIIGKTLESLFEIEESFSDIREILNQKEAYRVNAETKRTHRNYGLNFSMIWDNHHEPYGIILAATDLTREEELIREAEAASNAKTEFLSNMSHEIRTPINVVLGMNHMILKECKDETILSYAEDIHVAGEALLSQINNILDFTRMDSGKMEITYEEYDTRQLITECRQLSQGTAEAKGLEFKLDYDTSLPQTLLGDKMRIRQVVTNLLSNAIKYTPYGSVCFQVTGQFRGEERYVLRLSVSDTGIGIRPEDQERLFQRFTRLDYEKNRAITGSGLGLSIVDHLLHLMQGSIQVESVYGVGSTFTVEIPQGIGNREPIGQPLEREVLGVEAGQEPDFPQVEGLTEGKVILLADDLAMNRKVFAAYLKGTGIQIQQAENGREAVELARENRYDIIFLDHMMPVMDGIKAMEHIRKDSDSKNQDTPIVMLTANALSGDEKRYLDMGFTAYLAKPIQVKSLESVLSRCFRIHLESRNVDQVRNWENLSQILDIEVGLKNSLEDEELYEEILASYCEEAKDQELEEAYVNRDFARYQRAVHTVKSSARTIGAMKLGELAYQLEMAAKATDYDFIGSHHSELLETYRELLHRIGEHLKKEAVKK